MRTTLDLKEELIEQARLMTGIREKTALVHAGLAALIERAAARRLASLSSAMPKLKSIRRRRTQVK
jgi:hypothetical protein